MRFISQPLSIFYSITLSLSIISLQVQVLGFQRPSLSFICSGCWVWVFMKYLIIVISADSTVGPLTLQHLNIKDCSLYKQQNNKLWWWWAPVRFCVCLRMYTWKCPSWFLFVCVCFHPTNVMWALCLVPVANRGPGPWAFNRTMGPHVAINNKTKQ